MASKKIAAHKARLTRAERKIGAALAAVERERRRLYRKHTSRSVRREIDSEIYELKAQLQNARNAIDDARARLTLDRDERQPQIIAEQELLVRGYWDIKPKAMQERYPNYVAGVPKEKTRGSTAYDKLEQQLLSLTPAQRKRLEIRVVYGAHGETGEVMSGDDFDKYGLIIHPSLDTEHALNALSKLLVRAGAINTPRSRPTQYDEEEPDDMDYQRSRRRKKKLRADKKGRVKLPSNKTKSLDETAFVIGVQWRLV